MHEAHHVLVTGATGLVGGRALALLLGRHPRLHAWVLVRDAARWRRTLQRHPLPAARVTPLVGDLTVPGLGLETWMRRRLEARVTRVLHAAADTCFSRPLPEARRVNTRGTGNLLEVAAGCRRLERYVQVSTAFVAGRRTGAVPEQPLEAGPGWVNAYERSKHEAEALVKASGLPAVVARPSTIVCEDASGVVTQVNAVHRALRLHHAGLASLLPGAEDTPVDLVTNAFVSEALADIVLGRETPPATLHLCAGEGALPLGELLDRCAEVWAEDPAWKSRRVARPALTDLETWLLFESTVEETGDPRLRKITRSLSWFVPQLAYPKRFLTGRAEALLGRGAPPVRAFWPALLRNLIPALAAGRPAPLRRAG